MLTQFQHVLLDKIARDEEAETTAELICREVESLSQGVLCSMLTVDRAGLLHPLAGPSLPVAYSAALDGLQIGPNVGSCGSAAFLRQDVAVTDIFVDQRWQAFRDLAEPLGVKACWSSPILAGDGHTLGTFGFYYKDSRGPSAEERTIVAECLNLSAILLDRKQLRSDNRRLAYQDPLTGLGNRAAFEKTIEDASRGTDHLSLLLLNIDDLRSINDDLGYADADLLIGEMGRRLSSVTSPGQAFRINGGEFAVLLRHDKADQDGSGIAKTILAKMSPPLWFGPYSVSPVVNCGGAIFDADRPRDPDVLRRKADMALQHAKDNRFGRFVHFDKKPAIQHKRDVPNLQYVAKALSEDRVEAYYQPLVRLDTQEVIGLEALCRLRSPQGHIVPAVQFSEALKDPSIGTRVTERMLHLVTSDMRRWLDQRITLRHVSLNIGMPDFLQGDLCERIIDALSRQKIPHGHLLVEVAETVDFADQRCDVQNTLEQLRAAGVKVALDDFGTGYASLDHLLTLPVDIIKTDRSLLDRFSPGESGETLIKTLLGMTRTLDMQLLVEGVETACQASRLAGLGCGLAQGYFFGSPDSAEMMTEILLGSKRKRLLV
ncbi:putative bifunctional diguanylate cyclase/phosphodiesterase [Acidisoma silvae]|uniref:EAL domain-containing protein n=1 Tax=Acidisoma silvae TaxID=2802396 RepID=A0A963YTA0_9PROT|nr:GGDEF and EAL domain-containing protein [Acidisoma silvae]MCB8876117.1 EAL domain-containing protein [Acidisoma silvae]